MKRSLCALLALMLCISLLPGAALAAGPEAKLLNAHLLSTGYVPGRGHYITYDYLGETIASDKAGAGTNFEAWKRMSESDRRTVCSWYAGWGKDMAQQFGADGKQKMDNWALEKSGWKQAGNILRTNLMQAHYPNLYAYYGDPDSPTRHYLEFGADVTGALRYTPEESAELESKVRRFQAAEELGRECYTKLANLKQAQVNAAVTFISSELIKIIMDNALSGKPSGELGDLKDKVWETLDENLKITDEIKRITGLKYTSVQDAVDHYYDEFTGESSRIEGEAAIKAIELLKQLMAAQENMAEEMMVFCEAQTRDLKDEHDKLVETNNSLRAYSEREKAQRDAALQAAIEADAVLMDSFTRPAISVTRRSGESDADYYRRCLEAAKEWANRAYEEAKITAQSFVDAYTDEDGDCAYRQQEWTRYDTEMWRYEETNPFYEEMYADYVALVGKDEISYFRVRSLKDLFSYKNYNEILQTVYTGQQNVISFMEESLGKVERYISAWEDRKGSVDGNLRPMKNKVFTLCNAPEAIYGDWTLPDYTYDNFIETYFNRPLRIVNSRLEMGYALREKLQQDLDAARQEAEDYRQSVADFEQDLRERVYPVYSETEEELEYACTLLMDSVHGMENMQDSYPQWLKQYCSFTYAIRDRNPNTMIPLRTSIEGLWNFFAGLEEGSAAWDAQVGSVRLLIADYPEREYDYLRDISRASNMLSAAEKARSSVAYLNPVAMQNLSALCEGGEIRPLWWRNDDTIDLDPYCLAAEYGIEGYYGPAWLLPRDTPLLSALLDDLEGDSYDLSQMRALLEELLCERAEILANAAAKSDAQREAAYKALMYYELNGNPYATNAPNYTAFLRGKGSISTEAHRRCYNPGPVDAYYKEHIYPIVKEIWAVYNGDLPYNQVVNMTPGASYKPAGQAEIAATVQGKTERLSSGQRRGLSVTVIGADAAQPLTIPGVIWSSSDENVATVDGDGIVTAVGPGSATITATALGSPELSLDRETGVYTGSVAVEFPVLVTMDGAGSKPLAVSVARIGADKAQVVMVYNDSYEELDAQGSYKDPPPLTVLVGYYAADGRCLGVGLGQTLLAKGHTNALTVSLPKETDVKTVKVFLAESTTMTPLKGYQPEELTLQ